MQKTWNIKTSDPQKSFKLSSELGILPASAQVLINRGIDSQDKARRFLDANLSSLSSPFDIPNMKKAIERLLEAKHKKESILLFGDYDVDGITSLVLVKSVLIKEGFSVIHYLPHRVIEGYGLNDKVVKYAIEKDINLVITLDCGTSNAEQIKALKEAGIDTIVVDHHTCETKLPDAVAIVNPKLKQNHFDYLAGVGVAFKFIQALTQRLPKEELDLVCLGTVSDVMPLIEENRIIVKEGLKILKETKREGLNALFAQARIEKEKMTTGYISYIIGPRINASGRIDTPEAAFNLLMCDCPIKAKDFASQLEKNNQARQKIEAKILEEALSLIEREINFKDHRVIVIGKDGWHRGVLGIIASRITERFYRPTIIISWDDLSGRGSARSIKNFHILDAIKNCSHHLEGFGGHSHAAGLSLKKSKLDEFRDSINKIAKDVIKDTDLLPSLDIDAELSLGHLDGELVSQLESFSPFGAGNPKPLFASFGLKIKSKPVVLGRDTLKFWVSDGKFTYPVLGFGKKDLLGLLNSVSTVDIAYYPSLDTWQGKNDIQLNLEDLKQSS